MQAELFPQNEPKTPETKKPRREIQKEARRMMREHGLRGWGFEWNNHKTSAGICNYTREIIALSRLYAEARSWENTRNTILHEIAHALAGPEAGHGPKWRAIARAIGCNAERCFSDYNSANFARYIGTCGCECVHGLHRAPKTGALYDCTLCAKMGRPSRITWKDTRPVKQVANKASAPSKKAK